MFARGFKDTIKVLKICLKLFDLLISLKILDILKALTTVVELPNDIEDSSSNMIVERESSTIIISNMFHLSQKQRVRIAIILIKASMRKIPVNTKLMTSITNIIYADIPCHLSVKIKVLIIMQKYIKASNLLDSQRVQQKLPNLYLGRRGFYIG